MYQIHSRAFTYMYIHVGPTMLYIPQRCEESEKKTVYLGAKHWWKGLEVRQILAYLLLFNPDHRLIYLWKLPSYVISEVSIIETILWRYSFFMFQVCCRLLHIVYYCITHKHDLWKWLRKKKRIENPFWLHSMFVEYFQLNVFNANYFYTFSVANLLRYGK